MPSQTTTVAPTLAARLIAGVEKHGSPTERKLIATGQEQLRRFLDHPDLRRPRARYFLEATIENREALTFMFAPPPGFQRYALIDSVGEWAPGLRLLSEEIIRRKLPAHASLSLAPEGIQFGLRVVAGPEGISDPLLPLLKATPPPTSRDVRALEINAAGRLRLLAASEPPSTTGARLSGLLAGAQCQCHGLDVLEYQAGTGKWGSVHQLLVISPFPSYLLNARLLDEQHGFAYLLQRGGTRSHALIRADKERTTLTTPLLPVPPRKPGTTGAAPPT